MSKRLSRTVLLEQLVEDGIQYIFGNPGSSEEGLLDSIRLNQNINYILCLQETVAIAAADGYSRATRSPAVVQLHSGVGLGNGIGMIYQAFRGHSPIIIIAGEAGLRYENLDAQMACSLVDIAKPVTKYATRVVDPNSVLRVIRRAYKIAATPPCGPVFVALPMDVLDAENTELVRKTVIPSTRVVPLREDLINIAKKLLNAKNPIILIGDGIASADAQEELSELAELIKSDVYGVNSSEVNIACTHPRFRGFTGHMFGKDSLAIVKGRDVALICGTYVFPEVFPEVEDVFDTNTSVFHIDLDAYEIAKNHKVDQAFVGDLKLTLKMLNSIITSELQYKPKTESSVFSESYTNRRALSAQSSLLEYFAAEIRSYADKNKERLIIFDEALTNSPKLCQYLGPEISGEYFQTRGGSLGVSLPGVLGTQLAFPEKRSIAFSGDGGSMYVPQALWTAARYKIGAKFVICNNRSYQLLKNNIDEYWQINNIKNGVYPNEFNIDNPVIDFVKLAESMGVKAACITQRKQIEEVIYMMFADSEAFLVDLIL